jgi:hypothetical protein
MKKTEKITAKSHPLLVKLMKSVYPDYKGRKFKLTITDESFETHSYWSGGSKTYFKFINYSGNILNIPDNRHPCFQHEENRTTKLVKGLACIKNEIFCGHDMGLEIMLHPDEEIKQIE